MTALTLNDPSIPDKYPEILGDLAAKVAALLIREGMPENRAQELGFEVAEFVRHDWGGGRIYFPKGESCECSERDHRIFERFNGRNYAELSREFDLTEVRIGQIVKQVRESERRKRQGGLF